LLPGSFGGRHGRGGGLVNAALALHAHLGHAELPGGFESAGNHRIEPAEALGAVSYFRRPLAAIRHKAALRLDAPGIARAQRAGLLNQIPAISPQVTKPLRYGAIGCFFLRCLVSLDLFVIQLFAQRVQVLHHLGGGFGVQREGWAGRWRGRGVLVGIGAALGFEHGAYSLLLGEAVSFGLLGGLINGR
jgi:hypothetical protein